MSRLLYYSAQEPNFLRNPGSNGNLLLDNIIIIQILLPDRIHPYLEQLFSQRDQQLYLMISFG